MMSFGRRQSLVKDVLVLRGSHTPDCRSKYSAIKSKARKMLVRVVLSRFQQATGPMWEV